jgi:predicted O-methyltransferase YrrM
MSRMALRHRLSIRRGFLMSAIGLPARGYFVPYPFAAKVDRAVPGYPAVEALFAAKDAAIGEFLAGVGAYLGAFRAFGEAEQWRSRFFSPRDGTTAYAMMRGLRPRRVLEVGSGTSTWFMARAIVDGGIDCTITCIDPEPRRPVADLGVRHIARPLQPSDTELAAELEAGDVLFVDSSHIMLPGMDVDVEFNLMFPALAPGVVVHVHDIFLPENYPDSWDMRMYSEQNALIGWLVSGFFAVMFPGYYATTRHGEAWTKLAAGFAPLAEEPAGSLWMRRAGEPAVR